eukprot:746878-Hanusia_phi.AAC.1
MVRSLSSLSFLLPSSSSRISSTRLFASSHLLRFFSSSILFSSAPSMQHDRRRSDRQRGACARDEPAGIRCRVGGGGRRGGGGGWKENEQRRSRSDDIDRSDPALSYLDLSCFDCLILLKLQGKQQQEYISPLSENFFRRERYDKPLSLFVFACVTITKNNSLKM